MEKERLSTLIVNSRIFFVGIGGISMSGLAILANGLGFKVGGSDNHPSSRTESLKSHGIEIFNSQVADNIDKFNPDYIVKTAAILPNNQEISRANELGIRIFDRAEFLGLITEDYERVINISGTHGKTTTTSMTSMMLLKEGADPTVHLGAEYYPLGGTVRLGNKKNVLVSEACEFNRSFHHFRSTTLAITNIDHDHVDCYPTIDDVIDSFAIFMNKLDDGGSVVVMGDDRNIYESINRYKKSNPDKKTNIITCLRENKENCFSLHSNADFMATDITFVDGNPKFNLVYKNEVMGSVTLRIPGEHNIDNALIAAACAYVNGASFKSIIEALDEFEGADGRFTVKGLYKGAKVVVDYAHHPTAARATIEASQNVPHNNLWVVFQPLTFNRTKLLFEEYVTSLLPLKKVLFAEIFSDREFNNHDISSNDIALEINRRGGDAEFFENRSDIVSRLDELVSPGDLILILGPEDIRTLGDELCNK